MTDLVDMVRELVDRHIHRERYERHDTNGTRKIGDHVTTNPALLDQLEYAVQQAGTSEDGLRSGFMSKPAARLDVLDTLIRIDYEARDILVRLGGDANADTKTVIRRVHASVAGLDDADVNRAIKAWWTWCRVVTGWDLPSWSPDNTCPACGERGGLRIRLIERLGSCINDQCRAVWDEATIGLLADHIRSENDDEAA